MKKILSLLLGSMCATAVYAQTDSIGVYSVRGADIKRVEISKPTGIKISSAIVSAKAKVQFEGEASDEKFNGCATFRIYYAVPSAYDAAKYFMFTPSYSVKDLSVAQFSVKKKSRYLTTSSVSIIGGSLGTQKAKDATIEVKQVRQNVYDITVSGPAGEYCIIPVFNGMASPYGGVFAFTIL